MRPPPGCGPPAPNGMPRSNTLPVLMRPPAATILSGVMRLTVPRSSSSPQRPQLLRLLADRPEVHHVRCSPSAGCDRTQR